MSFADVPHLLKLLRNHLVDNGSLLKSGEVMDRGILWEMSKKGCGELKVHPKLKPAPLNVKQSDRQRVRPAAQVFSHTIVTAMTHLLPEKCPDISKFLRDCEQLV